MFSPVDSHLPMFTGVYLFIMSTLSCLPVYPCIPMLTLFHLFSIVNSCLPMFTLVHLFSIVTSCLPVFPLLTNVYLSLPLFNHA